MRAECRIEVGIRVEHVPDEGRVLLLAGYLEQQARREHLAVVLFVALVLVPARFTRLWHVHRLRERRLHDRTGIRQGRIEQRIFPFCRAQIPRLAGGYEDTRVT